MGPTLDKAIVDCRVAKSGSPSAVCVAGAGQLQRVDAMGGLVSLVGSGVSGLQAVSDDFQWAMYFGQFDQNTGFTDLYLSSLAQPGSTTLSMATTASVFGDPFTSDGTHALFDTDCTQFGVGQLNALDVAGGGMPATLAKKNWVAYAGQGARVVYNDDYQPSQRSNGRADVFVVDLAARTPPVRLATAAEADFYLDAEKSRVVWSQSGNGPTDGIYVAAIP